MTTKKQAFSNTGLSVNQKAANLVDALVEDANELRIGVTRGDAGERLIDLGSATVGGYEAGRRLTEICMGGLGRASISSASGLERWPWAITISSTNPVLGCLASQYGGWTMSDDASGFFALGSGPARALSRKEELFKELGYVDQHHTATLVIEGDNPPPTTLVQSVADDCQVKTDKLNILYAPTGSLAGTVQVVGRVLEVALHKAHELGFPLDRIVDGTGVAPLSPPIPDFVQAMGRTNDAIIFAGRVQLIVNGDDDAAKNLAEKLPSRTSEFYGKPFAEIFAEVEGDFYKIDPMLFSPAEVIVANIETGRTFHAGGIDAELIEKSFS